MICFVFAMQNKQLIKTKFIIVSIRTCNKLLSNLIIESSI